MNNSENNGEKPVKNNLKNWEKYHQKLLFVDGKLMGSFDKDGKDPEGSTIETACRKYYHGRNITIYNLQDFSKN